MPKMGLGLPQVYGFAEQSGGSVHIESEVGRGAIVVFTPPRTDRALVEVEPTVVAQASRKSFGSVLLVEDDKQVASLVTDMLHELGYDVTHAARETESWRTPAY